MTRFGGAGACWAVLAFALLCEVPVRAAPSSDGDDPPLRSAGLISTPSVSGRSWSLTTLVKTSYDSNFTRSAVPISAWRVTPVVTGAIGLPIGRQQLFIGGDLGRDIFINKSNFNRNRYAVGGGLDWRLGSLCTGEVAGEYKKRQSQTSDLAVFRADNVQRTQTYGASATCRLFGRASAAMTVRRNITNNDLPERSAFDVRSTSYSPSLNYGTPTLGTFSLGADVNAILYPRRTVTTLDGVFEDRIKISSLRGGYSRTLGTKLSVNLGISYIKVSPNPSSELVVIAPGVAALVPRSGFSGTGFDVDIAYNPSSRLSANLTASRSVNSSPNVGASLVVQKLYGVDFNYNFSRAMSVGLGGTHVVRDYRGSFATAGEIRRTRDTVNRVFAQVNYSPVPLYSVGIEVAHQKRAAIPDIYNYSSTTAALTLRVKLGRG